MTVEHSESLAWAELLAAVRGLAADILREVSLVDRYQGSGVAEGRVRTTLRCVYRHPERSLTQDEVNAAQERLRAALVERLDVGFA
jgi:phenylalanyl-tRNA synthetase beta chain